MIPRMEQTIAPPTGLGPRGRKLWRAVAVKYQLTPTELELLHEMCSATDELGRLVVAAKQVRPVSKGSKGQDIAHPLFNELRLHRESIRRLARQLSLPDDKVGQRPRVTKSKGGLPTALRRRVGGGNVADA
jgi:hypothetical protein